VKNLSKLIIFAGMTLAIGFFAAGCTTFDAKKLTAPGNVEITVTGRVMTVTWDDFPGAQGYEIITTSIDCRSANRIINTAEKTAFPYTNNTADTAVNFLVEGFTSLKMDEAASSNGRVQIAGRTIIQIILMPEWNIPGNNTSGRNESLPMPTWVTAKVKALGNVGSEYSAVTAYRTVNKKTPSSNP